MYTQCIRVQWRSKQRLFDGGFGGMAPSPVRIIDRGRYGLCLYAQYGLCWPSSQKTTGLYAFLLIHLKIKNKTNNPKRIFHPYNYISHLFFTIVNYRYKFHRDSLAKLYFCACCCPFFILLVQLNVSLF